MLQEVANECMCESAHVGGSQNLILTASTTSGKESTCLLQGHGPCGYVIPFCTICQHFGNTFESRTARWHGKSLGASQPCSPIPQRLALVVHNEILQR